MTPEEAKEAMKKLVKQEEEEGDREQSHIEADELLCDILKHLGYGDAIALYKKLPKWHA